MIRFLRSPEVQEATGLSQTTIWRKEKAGEFPRRRQIGPNTVGWIESEVEDWISSRPVAEPKAGSGADQ